MYKSFVFSLFLCLGSFTIAQDASLTGLIIDFEDEEPLIGASVKIIGQSIGGVTDINGKFKINNLSKGEYSLAISYVGYIDKELKINIKRGNNNINTISYKLSVISDTDLLTLQIWCEYKYKKCHPFIIENIKINPPDLYLICSPNIPWEFDPQRENPKDRIELYNIHLKKIKEMGVNFEIIQGDIPKRLIRSKKILQNLQF